MSQARATEVDRHLGCAVDPDVYRLGSLYSYPFSGAAMTDHLQRVAPGGRRHLKVATAIRRRGGDNTSPREQVNDSVGHRWWRRAARASRRTRTQLDITRHCRERFVTDGSIDRENARQRSRHQQGQGGHNPGSAGQPHGASIR